MFLNVLIVKRMLNLFIVQKFGEITDIMEDQATPSVILKYKTRRFAETAMSSGKI